MGAMLFDPVAEKASRAWPAPTGQGAEVLIPSGSVAARCGAPGRFQSSGRTLREFFAINPIASRCGSSFTMACISR